MPDDSILYSTYSLYIADIIFLLWEVHQGNFTSVTSGSISIYICTVYIPDMAILLLGRVGLGKQTEQEYMYLCIGWGYSLPPLYVLYIRRVL